MQTQLLAQYPSEQLQVYAVWLPMLWGDSRAMWDGTNMPDTRVMHFWDGEHAVGEWFAKEVDGYEGISWDAYYLYGPDATWETAPSPLLGSGQTIYAEREKLKNRSANSVGQVSYPSWRRNLWEADLLELLSDGTLLYVSKGDRWEARGILQRAS